MLVIPTNPIKLAIVDFFPRPDRSRQSRNYDEYMRRGMGWDRMGWGRCGVGDVTLLMDALRYA